MNRYFKITIRTFTIWVASSLINGLLCGIYFSVIGNEFSGVGGTILFIIISLVFSIPGFLLFWIFLLIGINRKVYARALFRTALSTGLILSLIYMVFGSIWLRPMLPVERYPIGFIVISVLAGILLHFKHFKNIHNQTT